MGEGRCKVRWKHQYSLLSKHVVKRFSKAKNVQLKNPFASKFSTFFRISYFNTRGIFWVLIPLIVKTTFKIQELFWFNFSFHFFYWIKVKWNKTLFIKVVPIFTVNLSSCLSVFLSSLIFLHIETCPESYFQDVMGDDFEREIFWVLLSVTLTLFKKYFQ